MMKKFIKKIASAWMEAARLNERVMRTPCSGFMM